MIHLEVEDYHTNQTINVGVSESDYINKTCLSHCLLTIARWLLCYGSHIIFNNQGQTFLLKGNFFSFVLDLHFIRSIKYLLKLF